MADFRDSLSLSLDDILAAAHKLAVEQSPEAGEIENQTTMNATETQPAQTTQPSQASAPAVENDHQSIEVPAETPIKPAAPTQQSSGFNFVFEPEAIERLESLLNGASQSEPAPQGSLSAVESVAPAPEATPAPSAGSSPVPVQSTAPAPAAVADISEKRSAAPSMVMTGIVSDYAQPNQQPAQQAQPAPQQQAQQQPAPQQQSAPVQQPVQQQQSTQQPVAQQQPVVQQPVQQQQQQPTQQQPASQQQPIQQSYAQAEAPAQSCPAPDTQPQTVQPEPEPPADNDASIEVISALPAIPRAFTSELDQDPAPDPIQTSAHAKQPEPLRSRQEQRAAQRAAEIAAGQREPSHSHPTGGEGRHANPAGTEDDSAAQGNQSRPLDNVVPPRSSARQRRSHNELASQAEVRSWEQAGVQRAALEFLKNSRREYGKSQDSQDVAQPYPADSGFTQPIKLNPVEATSAVSEARRAEVEQKVFVNSQPVTSAQDQDSREYTAAPAAAPANTPATTIDAPPDLLPDMPMSAPIDPDNNDMSWVDASRPEWTELPTKKSRRNKKKHEPEEEPVHEKKSKRQRKESEKATKHDRIAEDEQFRSALTNGTSFSEAALDAGVASSIDDRMRQARKQQNKRIKRRVIIVVVLCLLGAGIGAGAGLGYYPITVENGQIIFGDNKLVLGDKQSPTSSGSTSSSGGSSSGSAGGTAGGSKKAEKEKDQSGTVIYGYSLTDPNGEPYTVTETVEFGSEGLCGNSTTEATFANAEAAADYLATVKRDYGKSFVGGSNEGTKTTVTVDVTSSKLDREQYEDALRNTVADLMIIKKS